MKAKLTIELDFESWFDEDREPKNNNEWTDFFMEHYLTDSHVIGNDDGENQDLILINSLSIKASVLK